VRVLAVQVPLSLLDGRSPHDAVDAPRWIVGGMEMGEPDDHIRIEDGCAEAARDALSRATLHALSVPRGSEWLGHAQAIWLKGGARGRQRLSRGRRGGSAAGGVTATRVFVRRSSASFPADRPHHPAARIAAGLARRWSSGRSRRAV